MAIGIITFGQLLPTIWTIDLAWHICRYLFRGGQAQIYSMSSNFIQFYLIQMFRLRQDGRSQSGTSWRSSRTTNGKGWTSETIWQTNKQTNPKTNKQTGQKRSLTAEGVKGTLEWNLFIVNIGINNISFTLLPFIYLYLSFIYLLFICQHWNKQNIFHIAVFLLRRQKILLCYVTIANMLLTLCDFWNSLREYSMTRSLGALRAPTSSLKPFRLPWLGPLSPSVGRSGRVTHATSH